MTSLTSFILKGCGCVCVCVGGGGGGYEVRLFMLRTTGVKVFNRFGTQGLDVQVIAERAHGW